MVKIEFLSAPNGVNLIWKSVDEKIFLTMSRIYVVKESKEFVCLRCNNWLDWTIRTSEPIIFFINWTRLNKWKLKNNVFTTALSLQFNLVVIESNIFGDKWCHFSRFAFDLEYIFFWFVGDVLKAWAFRGIPAKKSTGLGYRAWRPLNWSYHSRKNFGGLSLTSVLGRGASSFAH